MTGSGNHNSFHTICAECTRKLKKGESIINGRGRVCNKKHLRRTQRHWSKYNYGFKFILSKYLVWFAFVSDIIKN